MNDDKRMELSPLKRAYLAIQELEDRVAAFEARDREPIAIVGIGCRFPGGVEDVAGFADALRNGIDAISEEPADGRSSYRRIRNDVSPPQIMPPAGFLTQDVGGFDPQFFNIAPREAVGMDPQQRLLLEVAWEAFEDAAESPQALYESRTGVFIGICGNDYAHLLHANHDTDLLDAHYTSGVGHSVASGRLSYHLGLQGPSISVDTACSSSLVTTHLACRSLRSRECDMAVAGGVNLILDSDLTIAFGRSGMLAADGRCKTFADGADGFARGEGCGIILLKRLSDAVRDGNRIHAVVRGTAVNQDGPSSALSAPNGPAQEAVIRAALKDAALDPLDVDYVEAHGTGTELGDPIEVRALNNVYGVGRAADRPLLIGSVKTNLGHLEGTAGIAGLIKATVALEHGFIPPHLHWHTPSHHIPWSELNVEVASAGREWANSERPRRSAVSSFGFSGTNCHVVLEQGPPAGDRERDVEAAHGLLTLSAASRPALKALAARYVDHLQGASAEAIEDACFTSNVGRAHLSHRLAIVGRGQEVTARLTDWVREDWADGAAAGRTPVEAPRVAFAFTGQGSQYPSMTRRLYAVSGAFRDAIDACRGVFLEATGEDLLDVLYGGKTALLSETRIAQPALFVVEWALAELLSNLGIRPVAVFGHSLGEYVAACIAGVFSVNEGIRLTARRGELMQQTDEGEMLAVAADEASVTSVIADGDASLSIAAVNGPAAVVVSGTVAAIDALEQRLGSSDVRTHRLNVGRAFHSSLMDPVLDTFEAEVSRMELKPPRTRFISALTGAALTGADATSPSYWRRHLRGPVRFAAAMAVYGERQGMVIEVGPHPVLSGFEREGKAAETVWIPTLRRDADDRASLLGTLQALHVAGVEIDWKRLHERAGLQRIDLPLYPFQRQHYWFERTASSLIDTRAENTDTGHPLLGRRIDSPLSECLFEARLTSQRHSFVADHRVGGSVIMPAAGFMEAARAAGERVFGGPVAVRELELHQAMVVPSQDGCVLQSIVGEPSARGATVRLYSREAGAEGNWTLHASGRCEPAAGANPEIEAGALDAIRARCPAIVEHDAFYEDLGRRRLDFGPTLRGLRKAWLGNGEALAEIELPEDSTDEAAVYGAHPALIDACLQTVAATLGESLSADALFLPINVGRFRVLKNAASRCYAHARADLCDGATLTLRADVVAYDDRGDPVFVAEDLRFQLATSATLRQLSQGHLEQYLYKTGWQPLDAPASHEDAVREWQTRLPTDLQRRAAEHDLAEYEKFFAEFELLCADYFALALRELGWTETTRAATADELAKALGVVAAHRRLFARMLEVLAESGRLSEADGRWSVDPTQDIADVEARLAQLATRYPAASAEITLVRRCGPALARALRGDCDPLELLFPQGSLADAERLYRDSPLARIFNLSVADAVEQIATKAGRRLRILEIGAGTGGTTSHVLERLGDRVDYTFTDVSSLFTARAQERLASYGNVSFRELDIESDPVNQGFAEHTFDIVIASNVLHATSDLRSAVEHARRMLAPGGVLIALEVLAPHNWFDLTVGLTPGWWKFEDADLRQSYPTLDADGWNRVLDQLGFQHAHVVPGDAKGEGVFARQGIVVAQAPATGPSDARSWLILADREGYGQRLADQLAANGQTCRLVHFEQVYGSSASATPQENEGVNPVARLLEQADGANRHAIVHLWSLDAAGPIENDAADLDTQLASTCRSTLDLALACAGGDPSQAPEVWVVTRGGQSVTADESFLRPAQATAWGLARSIDLEHPALRFTRVDLDPSNPYDQAETLAKLMLGNCEERQIALRDGEVLVPRLQRWRPPARRQNEEPYTLACRERGAIDNLEFRAAERREPAADEVEICVEATALNFKDVLNVLGLYPGDPGLLGSECAGVVTRVGRNVDRLAPGDSVMAYTGGSYDRFVTAPAAQVMHRPEGMHAAEAATIPVAFLTAAYALSHCAHLRATDSVLVHAAAGGVGMAAVQLAMATGATIYATAGTPEKRQLLHSLGVEHVYDSRTLSFADEVLRDTSGRGVDVVLNSLADEFVDRSFEVIAKGGRFLEIGKRGIWDPDRVADLGRDIEYHVIDWGITVEREPAIISRLFEDIVGRFQRGELRSLPARVFPRSRLRDAFRYMAQGRHVGKIVLAHESAQEHPAGVDALTADATYVITGGLSGLGLLAAEWLVRRGACHLALIGRRSPDEAARSVIAGLEAAGASIAIGTLDISDRSKLGAFLNDVRDRFPPIRGILQSAGVLDDGVLLSQTWARFQTVFAPKVVGSWNLHELTRGDPLDFMVLFSSLASMVGSSGQANHAAANAFMDVLASARRRGSAPAVSINWGPWSEAGAAVRHGVIERGVTRGLYPISPDEGFATLELIMASDAEQVGVANVNWESFLDKQQPAPAFFEALRSKQPAARDKVQHNEGENSGLLERFASLPPAKRRGEILRFVRTQVVRLLGLPGGEVETDRPLSEMGLDSLLAVEIRNVLGRAFDMTLPATVTFDHPSIEALAVYLDARKFPEEETQIAASRPQTGGIDSIEGYSEEDLDRLIAEKLKVND